VLPHDLKVGVWCALSMWWITGPVSFHDIKNYEYYVALILPPVFNKLTEKKKCAGILYKIMHWLTL
jgi:hypothetical protein